MEQVANNMSIDSSLTPIANIAFAFDYLEEVNYALVQSKMDICNWCIVENISEMDIENI